MQSRNGRAAPRLWQVWETQAITGGRNLEAVGLQENDAVPTDSE